MGTGFARFWEFSGHARCRTYRRTLQPCSESDCQLLQAPTLLGHSFGSVIAAHAVAQRSVRYRQLVLLNPIVKSALAAQTPIDRAATILTDGFTAYVLHCR